MYRADFLLKHELARLAAVEDAEQHRRAHRRMAGERKFAFGGEDAAARPVLAFLRRQHEHRLRQVELVGNRLHRLGIEAVRLEHDGERIAGEAAVGEDVKCEIAALHRRPPEH